jgi:hypothetical protein
MSNTNNNLFIKIQNNFLRKDSIIIIKPSTIVQYDSSGREISRDFSKMIIQTTAGHVEFLYGDDQARDAEIAWLLSILNS